MNYFVYSYIKPISERVASINNNKSDTIVGFYCLNKLNRFIKVYKNKNKPQTNNNIVYKICCKNCASYVGQTKR